MKKFEEIPKEKQEMAFYITEYVREINYVLAKVDMLIYDISEIYLGKVDLITERGKINAEYELKIARIKSEVVRDYMQQAGVLQNELTKLSDANFNLIKEEETKQVV